MLVIHCRVVSRTSAAPCRQTSRVLRPLSSLSAQQCTGINPHETEKTRRLVHTFSESTAFGGFLTKASAGGISLTHPHAQSNSERRSADASSGVPVVRVTSSGHTREDYYRGDVLALSGVRRDLESRATLRPLEATAPFGPAMTGWLRADWFLVRCSFQTHGLHDLNIRDGCCRSCMRP